MVLVVVRRDPARIRLAQALVPAGVDLKARLLQVASFAGFAVELDQGHLDLGVAVRPVQLAAPLAEGGADQVGEAARDPKRPVRAGHSMVGDRGLEEVSGAVQLVRLAVAPALAAQPPHKRREKVAVRLLGLLQQLEDGVHPLDQPGILVGGQLPAGRLHPFVDVAVVEDLSGAGAALEARRHTQVVEAAGLFQHPVLFAQADGAVELPARLPESVGETHCADGDRPQPGPRAQGGVDHRRHVRQWWHAGLGGTAHAGGRARRRAGRGFS